MNTLMTAGTATTDSRVRRTGPRALDTEPRARFTDLLAAEWLKFRSLRSIPWVLGLSALAVIAAGLKSALYTRDHYTPGDGDPVVMAQLALNDAFNMAAADILLLVAGGLGAIVIAGEYATGLIRTTLAAVPDRRAVLLAKACVLAAAMLGYGLLTVGVSFGLTQAILSDVGIGQSLSDPAAFRYVAAAVLFGPVCALVGLGLGTLIRHSAGAVVGTVVVLFFLPSLLTERYRWTADLLHALPLPAFQRLARTTLAGMRPTEYPATVTGSWITFAAWALGSVAVATLVIHRRDH
ncbi:ABC transporter permease [Kitasatospora xanthocidica]|uniref:ABC transporter permease subunit n=1 Tax=Kitasatospora xanthocidica TaxID=83382 RepID=UPI00198D3994|nr:ABC transporter permease subunit [Kitasatospora xanthocidica]GHF90648.1 ABC transporter permease [Kitasatospora xanthocidica]